MPKVNLNRDEMRAVIMEQVRRALLKEEEEETNSANKIVDLISFLHNAQLPVREIHWNTRNNALHLLTDETLDELLDWEDRLAETYLSNRGNELKINDTKPSSTEYEGIMDELCDITKEVKEEFAGKDNYEQISSIVDEILETANKNLYRGEFK